VEHLLRDVKDATISTLATDVSAKLQALRGLQSRLVEIKEYMELVLAGQLPMNHDIMFYLQVNIHITGQLFVWKLFFIRLDMTRG
jgi:26S proteasome regulatory subunit N8